jgi:hypothetical protein
MRRLLLVSPHPISIVLAPVRGGSGLPIGETRKP